MLHQQTTCFKRCDRIWGLTVKHKNSFSFLSLTCIYGREKLWGVIHHFYIYDKIPPFVQWLEGWKKFQKLYYIFRWKHSRKQSFLWKIATCGRQDRSFTSLLLLLVYHTVITEILRMENRTCKTRTHSHSI